MRRRLLVLGATGVVSAGLVFALTDPATGVVVDGFFIDDNGSQFEADIDAVADAGITRGCNAAGTLFCPASPVTRGEMAAFLQRSLNLPVSSTDFFTDDAGSQFEANINAIAQAGITRGCDPAGVLYCPHSTVTRGEMAAFLRRALNLAAATNDYFNDDQGSIFEEDINAIFLAEITRGCDNTGRYCPSDPVTRGQMGAFLRRGLQLPDPILRIPMGEHPALACPGGGNTCTLVVDLTAGRQYRIEEGVFQALPATDAEMTELNSASTRFSLTIDGVAVSPVEEPLEENGQVVYRRWGHLVTFTQGTHTVMGSWTWNGTHIQSTTVTVRAG